MSFIHEECPRSLDFKIDPFGRPPKIVDQQTGRPLAPYEIVHAYNLIADKLAERIASDVD